VDNHYTGYQILDLSDHELTQLYEGKYNYNDLKENEYLIIKNNDKVIDYFCKKKNELKRINYPLLENNFTGEMKPRNPQQYCAMDLLKDNSIPVKLITGSFGSGKTMMCIIAALEAIEKGLFDKIVFIRNNVQVKDTELIGALPGDVFDKTLPYVLPFADHCGGIDGVEKLIDDGQLEVIPLAFLRGRSIRNSIIYSMESENLTKEHIQLIMGRVDEGSQLWMDGDIKQRDKLNFEKSQGLETMIERLSGNKLFGYVHLIKSERSEVARLCDLLD
jgi:PhoH-like ATPase